MWDLLKWPRPTEACGLGREKSERAGNEESLILRGPHGQPQYEAAAMLRPITEGQSYQWNS